MTGRTAGSPWRRVEDIPSCHPGRVTSGGRAGTAASAHGDECEAGGRLGRQPGQRARTATRTVGVGPSHRARCRRAARTRFRGATPGATTGANRASRDAPSTPYERRSGRHETRSHRECVLTDTSRVVTSPRRRRVGGVPRLCPRDQRGRRRGTRRGTGVKPCRATRTGGLPSRGRTVRNRLRAAGADWRPSPARGRAAVPSGGLAPPGR